MARKSVRTKSALEAALDQIGDETIREFRDLLTQAKSDATQLIRLNAEELEERLVLLKEQKIDKEDFDFFVENQRRELRDFVATQPPQAQQRAEKLTLNLLELCASKVQPILLSAFLEGDSHTRPPRD
jgi:hypothetical protein